MDRSQPNPPLERRRWPLLCLLLLFFLAGANSLVRDSATFDETAHLPAGFSYLDRADFRMNPEHPPLSKAWAALPLWLAGLAEPDYDSPYWTGEPSETDPARRSKANQWLWCLTFCNLIWGIRGPSSKQSSSKKTVHSYNTLQVTCLHSGGVPASTGCWAAWARRS